VKKAKPRIEKACRHNGFSKISDAFLCLLQICWNLLTTQKIFDKFYMAAIKELRQCKVHIEEPSPAIQRQTVQLLLWIFMKRHKKLRDLVWNKGRAYDPGGKRSGFALELDSIFHVGAPDSIQEIQRNWVLSKQKKEEDIMFYVD